MKIGRNIGKCNRQAIVSRRANKLPDRSDGLRHDHSGNIQRYICGDCHRTFSLNLGFEKMKATPETVTMAIQMYFSGMSFEFTAKALKLKA